MGSTKVTVRQLVAMLKKMPQGARVVWKDHDHSTGEFNAQCKFVHVAEDEVCEELGEPSGNVVAISG